MSEDRYDLERFIKQQQDSYHIAYQEVSQGQKRSHWMWWIFPQIVGLGMTTTSHHYSIKSMGEAKAFLAHHYLGAHIREIAGLLLTLDIDDAYVIFGSPDYLKLRSSMTLFAEAAPEEEIFQQVLDKFYNGQKDEKTLAIISK